MTWRASKEYRIWRLSVIRRDCRCVICNSLQNRQAHHLNSAAYFTDERFDISNGITLCAKCHTSFHCNFKKSFKEKCTKDDFLNFKELVNYIKSVIRSVE